MTYEHICNGLCEVEESIEGLSFCPRKFICNDKMIIDIRHMEFFIHLQDLNLAFNAIEDIRPLQKLTLLQKLDCSFNQISEIPNVTWPFLVYLNLNDNRITKLPKMSQPILQILCLNHNLISSLVDEEGAYLLEEDALPRLHTIELRGNRLSTSLPNFAEPEKNPPDLSIYLRRIGFSHSGLKMLVMAENSLSSLAAVYHPPEEEDESILKLNPLGSRMGLVPGLVVLHLRKNGIKHLHGFTAVCFASLEYLNLRYMLTTSTVDTPA
ncbi:unnamed protein product [Schistocephalus solidus]|uniref:Uncharacterized protein n=1 Tax=Schistocephalus solidus TaxID=70667 RepID=A0A3P7BXX3_SCHSO|nr:unnamed protein product [Schistocephalus solidus]